MIRGFVSSSRSAAADGETGDGLGAGYFHAEALPEIADRMGTTLLRRRSAASADAHRATVRPEQKGARGDVTPS